MGLSQNMVFPLRLISCILPLLILFCTLTHAAEAPETVREVNQLVALLSSDDFDERSAATERLAAMGELAREALEQAVAGKDPEIRIAATTLLARLGQTSLDFLLIDSNGLPAAGVQGELNIAIEGDESEPVIQPFVSREDGTASAGRLEPALYILSFTWKGGWYSTFNSVKRVRLMPGANRIVIPVSPCGSIQATALDAGGKPLKDIKLTVDGNSQVTDGDGKARIDNLIDGTHRLVWSRESEKCDGPLVHVRQGRLTEVPAARLEFPAHDAVAITLQNANGEPVANSNVFVSLTRRLDDPVAEYQEVQLSFAKLATAQFEPTHHTDEKGQITIESIEPGKYRLLLRSFKNVPPHTGIYPPWAVADADFDLYTSDELEIKTGAPQPLTLRPVSGGSVAGKVRLNGGTATDTYVVLLQERYSPFIAAHFKQDFQPSDAESTATVVNEAGSFEIKHVPAGRYCAYIKNSDSSAYVFGIDVTDGETTELSAANLSAPAAGNAEFKTIRGKVMLPDGKPCADADVYLLTENPNGSTNDTTGNDGDFSIDALHANLKGVPSKLKIFAAGCEPATCDLKAEEIPPQLTIHLRTQLYGGLKVKTVDDAGKPVTGVKIWPLGLNPLSKNHLKRSDTRGELNFTGLATGVRKFNVEKTGYFLDAAPTAVVLPGKEDTSATVTLHPGLKITGKVELPPNYPPSGIGVYATHEQTGDEVWSKLNDKNEFSFSGLQPGTYLLNAASGCCVLDGAPARVTLSPDQKAGATVNLRLIRLGALALNCGAATAKRILRVLPADAFKNVDKFWYYYSLDLYAGVDSTGRAEFSTPGASIPFCFDETPNDFHTRPDVGYAGEPVDAAGLPPVADFSTLPATESKLKSGTAGVTVAFVPEYPENVQREALAETVEVVLAGPNAICSLLYRTQMGPPVASVVGTPPPDLQFERQTFTIARLPAGDYRLIVLVSNEENTFVGQKVLASVTLKDGESTSLGEFKLPIPKSGVKLDPFDVQEPEIDKDDAFKP